MQQHSDGILIIAAPSAGEKLGGVLTAAGYELVQVTDSAYQGIAAANERGAALAVVTQSLAGVSGADVAQQLERVCPVILLCTRQQSDWIGALGRHIMLLTTPLKVRPFMDAVELSLGQRRHRQDKPPATRGDAERRIIESAKQRLMDVHHMAEPDAHRHMQKMSMDSGKPLPEIAKIILELL